MGLFDIFSGAPAREAAERNAALFRQNQERGQGYLDTAYNQGRGDINQAIGSFAPLAALGQRYAGATNLYQDALGVNGAAGNARATGAFQAGPGYEFALNQGLQAVDRSGAGKGMSMSGNTLQALQQTGQGLANQEYGNWLNRLGGFVSPELQATSGAATGQAAGHTNLANLGNLYGQNSTNLGTTTTSGLAQANSQAAQAQMQGSQNLWNLGTNLLGSAFRFMG